ncbi:MAG: hypothetical protein D6704_05175 [Nitrospirae bacterium]|nr:MAG: hypothetical protein D6704_05175 [Nitrospirota bacterium]
MNPAVDELLKDYAEFETSGQFRRRDNYKKALTKRFTRPLLYLRSLAIGELDRSANSKIRSGL